MPSTRLTYVCRTETPSETIEEEIVELDVQ